MRDNYISADITKHSALELIINITSTYPITSPIKITYSAQGTYYVIDTDDEWGSSQPTTEYFDTRNWTKTLSVGQTEWSETFIPDVYGELEPGLPSKASIISVSSMYMNFTEFSDNNYNYKKR